ncbi:MAG TPA: hypothetical protein VHX61_13700 [Rhizomicrobium sp.]|jgi:hypothetical protein|nr:hypothetical protein [Rhizomicrobium sp.]
MSDAVFRTFDVRSGAFRTQSFYYTIKSGTYTDIDIPGSSTGTDVFGVNDNDVIVAYEPWVPGEPSGVSYVYCLKSKGCPTGSKYNQPQQHRGQARPEHWRPMP